jgi:type II secretory pathway predicted ATPase ExeA/cell division protein FtsN
MDPTFFGLEGHPFDNSSDHDETYITETHAALITELRAGLKAPHGITLLIGEEGTGKTTLVRKFADESAENCTVAYLPTTGPGLRHLLTETIEQLGGSPPPAGDEQALLDCLASLARARAEHGRTTLVIVDDAHELPAKTIERVGRLFGDDPAEPSMLHVILVGRPELLDRMNAANDRTILKHLVQVCRMDPIGPEESFRYIADRIAKVGGIVDKLFTEDALRMIVKRANGNPGRIDAICSAALEQAAESGEAAVAADTVDMACVDAEALTMESNGTAAEKDPMQYIFGEEEVEDRETRVTRRLHGSVNGTNGTGTKEEKELPPPLAAAAPSPAPAPRGAGTAMMLADAVRERFGSATGNVSDGRKRLGLWALGLVVILAGFAATMTRTVDRGQLAGDHTKPTKIAAAEGKTAEGKAVEGKTPDQVALPATAVRTSKLIVKRDGEAPTEAAATEGDPEGSVPGTEPTQAPTAVAAQPAPPAPMDAPQPAAAQPSPSSTPTAASPAPQPAPPSASAPAKATPAPAPASATASAAGPVTQPSASAPQQPQPAHAAASVPALSTPPHGVTGQAATAKAPETKAAPTQLAAATAAKPTTATPPASSAAPVSTTATAASSAAAAHAPAAGAAQGATAERAKVASAKAPAATAGAAKYTVQVGAFKSRENADALADKIRKSYPDARVIAGQGGAPVFRVVSGAFASKADADSRAKTLAGNGYTTFVRDLAQ